VRECGLEASPGPDPWGRVAAEESPRDYPAVFEADRGAPARYQSLGEYLAGCTALDHWPGARRRTIGRVHGAGPLAGASRAGTFGSIASLAGRAA